MGTLGVGEFFQVLTLGIVGKFFWRSPPGESDKKLERVPHKAVFVNLS
ncbi:hypothetical protein D082_19680 [Synechocystis sp. PCC 6714]|nr:hypothetical protein D082_19680 [Synechocystis sp. PCC 6714]